MSCVKKMRKRFPTGRDSAALFRILKKKKHQRAADTRREPSRERPIHTNIYNICISILTICKKPNAYRAVLSLVGVPSLCWQNRLLRKVPAMPHGTKDGGLPGTPVDVTEEADAFDEEEDRPRFCSLRPVISQAGDVATHAEFYDTCRRGQVRTCAGRGRWRDSWSP